MKAGDVVHVGGRTRLHILAGPPEYELEPQQPGAAVDHRSVMLAVTGGFITTLCKQRHRVRQLGMEPWVTVVDEPDLDLICRNCLRAQRLADSR